MKKIYLFILTLGALCFCACDSNKGKVEELAYQFVSAVNAKDKVSIYSIFPNAKNISNMTLPESIQTGDFSVEKNDSNYIVTIANTRQQKLVFKVIGESQIEMVESYSILDLDSAAMELAIKTGVPMKQIPDLAISKLMDIGGDYIEHLNTLYSDALKGGLIREGGTWQAQRAYGGNVTVAQPIRNVGDVPIKGSEYNVEFTFYSPNGTSSARLKKVEEGVDLEPNEATTIYVFPGGGYVEACYEHDFSWTVSFVYKNLSPIGTLLKYVKFTGNEYDDYLKANEKVTKGNDKSLDTEADSAKGVHKAAVINDPDGYTNVRATPDSKAEIVSKIIDGERFYFDEIPNSKWVKVYKTADSEAQCIGYMHNSRVKPVNDN